MPNIETMKESNFIKKEDCGSGIIVTIAGVSEKNIAKEGDAADMRWCLDIVNSEKPLILNSTNLQLIAQILGSKETDDWTGKQVVLYNDPSVSFGGKLTGGVRVRAMKGQAAKPKATFAQAEPEEVDDGSVPF